MNVLITGADGFIGSNLCEFLSKDFNVFKGTRKTIDLYSQESISIFIDQNEIDSVIHCAVEGGHKLKSDSSDIFFHNILMYENLIKFNHQYKTFINFSSGAEYDRRNDISNVNEYDIFDCVPIDYYGLSKNIISKLSIHYLRSVNLRAFGCFYHNELETRFIKNSITNYINKKPIIIHQDIFMDFFYMEDLVKIVKHFLNSNNHPYKDLNLSYLKKYKLSDIANLINNLSSYKVNVIIENKKDGFNYTGNGELLNSLDIKLKGLETGIKECYDKLL